MIDSPQNPDNPISNPLGPDGSDEHADGEDMVEAIFINRQPEERTDLCSAINQHGAKIRQRG